MGKLPLYYVSPPNFKSLIFNLHTKWLALMGPSSQTCLLFRALVSCYLGLAARGDVGEKATSITAKNSLG